MTVFSKLIRDLFADETGASMVEAALLLAVMVVAVMWGVSNIGHTLQGGIFGIADAIGTAAP